MCAMISIVVVSVCSGAIGAYLLCTVQYRRRSAKDRQQLAQMVKDFAAMQADMKRACAVWSVPKANTASSQGQ